MLLINFTTLVSSDIDEIVAAFQAIGWNKSRKNYEEYLSEQDKDSRLIFIARNNNKFCGYVTIKWTSIYFDNIPEIADLNVLPHFQNHGIGTKLIKQCEKVALERGYKTIGIGVGLTADYGNAQKLYIKLGYVPDGNGLYHNGLSKKYGETVSVDDELILCLKKSLLDTNEIELSLPSRIETPQLLLRAPQMGDANRLNQAVIESFDVLQKYMLWAKEKPTLQESEQVIRRESASWVLNKNQDAELMLLIFDKDENELIGATGFHHIDWDVPCAETGYWISKKYSGQGYMTEAINAVTRYAFNVLNLKRLVITCDADNERSKRIAQRLGYQFESLMKLSRIKPMTGEATDTMVYVRNDIVGLPELRVVWR